jgi:hypothetical protein
MLQGIVHRTETAARAANSAAPAASTQPATVQATSEAPDAEGEAAPAAAPASSNESPAAAFRAVEVSQPVEVETVNSKPSSGMATTDPVRRFVPTAVSNPGKRIILEAVAAEGESASAARNSTASAFHKTAMEGKYRFPDPPDESSLMAAALAWLDGEQVIEPSVLNAGRAMSIEAPLIDHMSVSPSTEPVIDTSSDELQSSGLLEQEQEQQAIDQALEEEDWLRSLALADFELS